MPRTTTETVPRQFRLGTDTLDQLDRISAHFGLNSRADAIRIAARLAVDSLTGKAAKRPKKSPTPAA